MVNDNALSPDEDREVSEKTAIVVESASDRRDTQDPTLADYLLDETKARAPLADLGVGANAHLAWRLLKQGYDGDAVFVDWRDLTLIAHRRALNRVASLDGLAVPANWSWKRDRADRLKLPGYVLSIQSTLPRWTEGGKLVKPKGPDHGARLLARLRATGARTLVAYVVDQDAETLAAGARSVGVESKVEQGVACARWVPCICGSLVKIHLRET